MILSTHVKQCAETETSHLLPPPTTGLLLNMPHYTLYTPLSMHISFFLMDVIHISLSNTSSQIVLTSLILGKDTIGVPKLKKSLML